MTEFQHTSPREILKPVIDQLKPIVDALKPIVDALKPILDSVWLSISPEQVRRFNSLPTESQKILANNIGAILSELKPLLSLIGQQRFDAIVSTLFSHHGKL